MPRKRGRVQKANKTIRESLSLPPAYRSIGRLDAYFTPVTRKITWSDLADRLQHDFSPHTLFALDTNVYTGPAMDATIWSQFTTGARRVIVPQLVLHEIQGWLTAPQKHFAMADLINAARRAEDVPVLIDDQARWFPEQALGVEYYINLLAERKRVSTTLIDSFARKHGRQPTTTEKNSLFQKGWMERDFFLLKKGEEELRTGGNFFTDEELVVVACAVGLASGLDTVIVTRDHDVFDQFAKLTKLLVVHYQGLLFADRFADSPHAYNITPMPVGVPRLDAYFHAKNSVLVRKPVENPDLFMEWLLPPNFAPVRLSCILLGGEAPPLSFEYLEFRAEKDLERIIAMKGKMRGLSTDRIIGRNCHTTGYPLGIPDPRSHVLVVQDYEKYMSDGTLGFPLLDMMHAITHNDVNSEAYDTPQLDV